MNLFLIRVINTFVNVIIYMIVGGALMSWFVRPGDRLYPLYMAVTRITEPVIAPFRNITRRFMGGGIDFSPMLAIFAIYFIRNILIRLVLTAF